MIRTECTWGDGPDIMMIVEGQHPIAFVNNYKSIQIDLTKEQAEKLISNLLMMVSQVKELESLSNSESSTPVEKIEYGDGSVYDTKKSKWDKLKCSCEKEICGICSSQWCDHQQCKCVEKNMR